MASLRRFRAAATLRVDDYERARRFYTEVLGLEEEEPGFVAAVLTRPSSEPSGTRVGPTREGRFLAGDCTWVSVYERPGLPAPQSTVLSFAVPTDKVEDIVEELRSKGVVFLDYDMPDIGLKTVNGVADMEGTKAAWFKDTEGNIIGIGSSESWFDREGRALPLLQ